MGGIVTSATEVYRLRCFDSGRVQALLFREARFNTVTVIDGESVRSLMRTLTKFDLYFPFWVCEQCGGSVAVPACSGPKKNVFIMKVRHPCQKSFSRHSVEVCCGFPLVASTTITGCLRGEEEEEPGDGPHCWTALSHVFSLTVHWSSGIVRSQPHTQPVERSLWPDIIPLFCFRAEIYMSIHAVQGFTSAPVARWSRSAKCQAMSHNVPSKNFGGIFCCSSFLFLHFSFPVISQRLNCLIKGPILCKKTPHFFTSSAMFFS